jgi:alpha-glucosidase
MPSPSVGEYTPWWRNAVCYQIYVRSFTDSDGDGIGDIAGITSRLPYLADLGVDAVWLTPFYRSPQADHGYDVTDYYEVDPLFGTLDDVDTMIASAHAAGLKVIVDVVPNHSSDQHVWFQQALAAGPGRPERARYVFRDGRGPDGSLPPNNWESMFGGSAWQRVPDGQWYLHLFDVGQPDFDWENPQVGDEFERVLRFWLDRGADGFRIDVAHGLVKRTGLPDLADADLAAGRTRDLEGALALVDRPYWDQPGVHEVYRRWHRVLADYPGDRMAIGEAWVATPEAMARYLRTDELQQCFNFHWLETGWSAPEFRAVVLATFAAVDPVGATPTWVLSNHDVTRTASRYGDGRIGVARARAAAMAMLALPGSAYLYAGEELGLPQVDVPEDARQDPMWGRGEVGRDGCRVPIPWSGTQAPYGFGPEGSTPWLPQPPEWASLSVEAQAADPGSTLAFFSAVLEARRDLLPTLSGSVELLDADPDVFAFRRLGVDGAPALVVAVNCGRVDVDAVGFGTPAGASTSLDQVMAGVLPPDTAAWFRD